CSLGAGGFATFSCADNSGPFGAGGIILPPGRNFPGPAAPSVSSFVAANGSPTLAPYFGAHGHCNPLYGCLAQYKFDIQRELPAGFFVDVAYAGSHGVHLEQYSTHLNQISDSLVAQAAAQEAAGQPVTIAQTVTNPLVGTSPNATIGAATITAGQLVRPYP